MLGKKQVSKKIIGKKQINLYLYLSNIPSHPFDATQLAPVCKIINFIYTDHSLYSTLKSSRIQTTFISSAML